MRNVTSNYRPDLSKPLPVNSTSSACVRTFHQCLPDYDTRTHVRPPDISDVESDFFSGDRRISGIFSGERTSLPKVVGNGMNFLFISITLCGVAASGAGKRRIRLVKMVNLDEVNSKTGSVSPGEVVVPSVVVVGGLVGTFISATTGENVCDFGKTSDSSELKYSSSPPVGFLFFFSWSV